MTTTTHATGTIENKSWNEEPSNDFGNGRRLARGTMVELFHGGVEAEGTVASLMAYGADGAAALAGFERMVGKVGSRSGSFVLQFSGTLRGQTATVTFNVVPGSGTDGLAGLSGQGGYEWDGKTTTYTLDYDLG
jgi:hypothetical protein